MEADFWNENAGENALAQLISFQKSEQNCDCLHNYIYIKNFPLSALII